MIMAEMHNNELKRPCFPFVTTLKDSYSFDELEAKKNARFEK